ncbi:hypothetical protein [Streptomyces mirabilis]|uniref:hypothetical protein n=1 Tax=Streptomyces mirabilis TaxID=68239 RepID=UPI003320DD23
MDSIDWSSMGHAYGPAGDVPVWLRAMASPDPEARRKALSDYYSAVHQQGDVYPCTAASLPFLFDMADDPAAPDRASTVELLLSIGREAVDRSEDIDIAPDSTESMAGADSVALMRERADAFISYSTDPDPRVRRAAIEDLGLFLNDADRAMAILQDRLAAENGIAERPLVVRTMTDLALRMPAARPRPGVARRLGRRDNRRPRHPPRRPRPPDPLRPRRHRRRHRFHGDRPVATTHDRTAARGRRRGEPGRFRGVRVPCRCWARGG